MEDPQGVDRDEDHDVRREPNQEARVVLMGAQGREEAPRKLNDGEVACAPRLVRGANDRPRVDRRTLALGGEWGETGASYP